MTGWDVSEHVEGAVLCYCEAILSSLKNHMRCPITGKRQLSHPFRRDLIIGGFSCYLSSTTGRHIYILMRITIRFFLHSIIMEKEK